MISIEWRDDYRIGVAALDSEHRDLIEGIAAIGRVAEQGGTASSLAALLEDWLTEFTHHVRKEDALLMRLTEPAGVSHREAHIAEHRRFVREIQSVHSGLLNGSVSTPALEGLATLLTLTELIRTDFEMVGHLRREGVIPLDE